MLRYVDFSANNKEIKEDEKKEIKRQVDYVIKLHKDELNCVDDLFTILHEVMYGLVNIVFPTNSSKSLCEVRDLSLAETFQRFPQFKGDKNYRNDILWSLLNLTGGVTCFAEQSDIFYKILMLDIYNYLRVYSSSSKNIRTKLDVNDDGEITIGDELSVESKKILKRELKTSNRAIPVKSYFVSDYSKDEIEYKKKAKELSFEFKPYFCEELQIQMLINDSLKGLKDYKKPQYKNYKSVKDIYFSLYEKPMLLLEQEIKSILDCIPDNLCEANQLTYLKCGLENLKSEFAQKYIYVNDKLKLDEIEKIYVDIFHMIQSNKLQDKKEEFINYIIIEKITNFNLVLRLYDFFINYYDKNELWKDDKKLEKIIEKISSIKSPLLKIIVTEIVLGRVHEAYNQKLINSREAALDEIYQCTNDYIEDINKYYAVGFEAFLEIIKVLSPDTIVRKVPFVAITKRRTENNKLLEKYNWLDYMDLAVERMIDSEMDFLSPSKVERYLENNHHENLKLLDEICSKNRPEEDYQYKFFCYLMKFVQKCDG